MAAPAQLIGGNEAQRTEEEQRFAELHIPLLFTAVGPTPKKKKKKSHGPAGVFRRSVQDFGFRKSPLKRFVNASGSQSSFRASELSSCSVCVCVF